jgi:hypothetical protein
VMRIPAVFGRSGDVPPAITGPDPSSATAAPAGPHR